MKKVILGLFLLSGLSIVNLSYAADQEKMMMKEGKMMHQVCQAKMDLNKAMRSLWEDHVIFTRGYIISSLANLPDADAVAQRLLKNQDDIGNAIKPYYGKDASAKLTALLREHITLAGEVVKAAKDNDSKGLEVSQKKWQDNATSIADFLSKANPNWSKDDLQKILFTHLDLTTQEVVARLNKDWNQDINAFDKGQAHMLMFADVLSDGIMKQFPDKFIKK